MRRSDNIEGRARIGDPSRATKVVPVGGQGFASIEGDDVTASELINCRRGRGLRLFNVRLIDASESFGFAFAAGTLAVTSDLSRVASDAGARSTFPMGFEIRTHRTR